MEGDRPLSAKEKRQEQIKRWENSATDLECETYANPKTRVKFDDGAVFLAACSAGDLNEVKALLDGGADINFANVDGLTALHQACIDGNLEVVQFLVEHGSEIDQEDNEGWTPLHATASCGFMDIAKYLVKKGANVAAVNSEAELPIDIAEEDEMIDYFQSEIDSQGVDVAAARDIERLVMLKDASALLNTHQNGETLETYRHSKSGATPMHITAAKGYNDVLKILIKVGLSVNATDNDGWTPLHAASHWSQKESAKILADKNANFKARSKLGQTPFDVADEDMLEYLEELETEQSENVIPIKDAETEPPPSKKDKKSSPTKDSSDISTISEVQNGEKRGTRKIADDSSDTSSEDETPVSPTDRVTALPPRPTSVDTKNSLASREKGKSTALTNDRALEDSSDRLSRTNRPASLPLTSEQPRHRPLAMMYSEGSSKPVAATQPVQSVGRANKENGGRAPTFARDTKEESPSLWRTGLRKTGSFDEKSKSNPPNMKSDLERSSSSSFSTRFSDDRNESMRTARVAPILDARKTKPEVETETDVASNDILSGYQRNPSFMRRKPPLDNVPAIVTTDTATDTTASFRRSVSYKKAVGRTESLENTDSLNEMLSRRPKTVSSVSEATSESTTNETSGLAKLEGPERRRSHLQPVRDEEAEAQRRIRSRRERQTRRSTQGVTLDVVEEAMRTIGQMKQKQPSVDKSGTDASSDASKSRNDSSSSSLKRSDDSSLQTPSATSQSGLYSGTSASASASVPSLPSGYIPSDQRVKANGAMESKTLAALAVPGISADASTEVDDDKDDTSNSTENGSSTAAQRKSAAQQRRRSRKERRSTGLPDLKPSTMTPTESNNSNEAEEEESFPKEDSLETGKAERLRAKYDSSSLPNRHERHRPGVRNSDSDIPSRLTQSQTTSDEVSTYSRNRGADAQNYKKLYEEHQSVNERLRSELSDAQRKISELESRLEKAEENSTRKQALENEKRERRALERKLADMEQELQSSEKAKDLRIANSHLRAENNALQRIVEKLGGAVPGSVTRAADEVPPRSKDGGLTSAEKLKSGSAPDLLKLEKEAEKRDETVEPQTLDSIAGISRSSSSSSLSLDEEIAVDRRGSYTSSRSGSEARSSPYLSSRNRDATDSASSAYSTSSSYSLLRNRARLERASSPTSSARSASPRRATASSASNTSTDFSRSSTYAPSRYTSGRKDLSGYSSFSSGYHTLPGSSARRDKFKSLQSSSGSLSSRRTGLSSYRSTPTATTYSSLSSSKNSYSSTSRPRQGYSSTTSRTDTTTSSDSKLSTPLSKYPTGLSSSRRAMNF